MAVSWKTGFHELDFLFSDLDKISSTVFIVFFGRDNSFYFKQIQTSSELYYTRI